MLLFSIFALSDGANLSDHVPTRDVPFLQLPLVHLQPWPWAEADALDPQQAADDSDHHQEGATVVDTMHSKLEAEAVEFLESQLEADALELRAQADTVAVAALENIDIEADAPATMVQNAMPL